MAAITLSKKTFRDKVYACWLGKNIGGTLGAPDECKKYTHSLAFYDPAPDGASPNDDLDLQLVWLVMMENEGIPPRLAHFGDYWRKYLHQYPWNEYGFCSRNLARGLTPPVSGWFENYYVDEMGSPIRSEIWACVAPGDPQRAAALAWRDSAVDHAGGEGTYGEMFWSAVQSAAFVLDDPYELIRVGLAMIPPACQISRAIREVVWCRRNGIRYDDARERLTRLYWNEQPCNAIPNHAFTIIGWLYGEDFGDRLCKAVNCGFDTDCTAATLGALLGILGGTAAIPPKWSQPVGTDIVIHKFTTDCGVPKTLDELTDRTVALAEKFAGLADANVSFGEATDLPADFLARLHRNEAAHATLRRDIRCGTVLSGDVEIALHYNGDPVLFPGVARRVEITCRKGEEPVAAEVALQSPDGWAITPVVDSDPPAFDVLAEKIGKAGTLQVTAAIDSETHEAEFTVLSPAEAIGYPNAKQADEWTPGAKAICLSPRRPELKFEKN
jgi:ADP-ribosylglycohydrolase